jgi:ribosomal protein S18 acetylase RimI-like enzyme
VRTGCVLLARESDEVAKLRIPLVEPHARGRGVGTALVDECVSFARGAGYRRVILWTDGGLLPARRLYRRAGFRKVSEEAHDIYGEGLVAETWELDL